MAEYRRFADVTQGYAGKIYYGTAHDVDASVETARLSTDVPSFSISSHFTQSFEAARTPQPEPVLQPWRDRIYQHRWLLRSQPEAVLGNGAIKEHLKEDVDRFGEVEGHSSNGALLARGQISYLDKFRKRLFVDVLAAATGESGELLRIARLEESNWTCEGSINANVQILDVDSEDPAEEVLWCSDSLPISRIEFVTGSSKHDPVRWLVVQKETSTTILRPNYRQLSEGGARPGQALGDRPLSHIDPNVILTISHRETGGNAHVNVTFSTVSSRRGSQMYILDECGFFTVWNIMGTTQTGASRYRKSLIHRGRIFEGLVDTGLIARSYTAQICGLVPLGASDVSAERQMVADDASEIPSQYMLFWNREHFAVFDSDTGGFLPSLPGFAATPRRPDHIFDANRSPVHPQHVVILTKEWLFWVDALHRGAGQDSKPTPRILLACAHLQSFSPEMKMTVAAVSREDPQTFIVCLFTARRTRVIVYWFTLKDDGLPAYHRHLLILPSPTKTFLARQLLFQPVAHTQVLGDDDEGTHHSDDQTRFLQCSILGEDLSVHNRLLTVAVDVQDGSDIRIRSVEQSGQERLRKSRRKRLRFLRRMGQAFVIPDTISGPHAMPARLRQAKCGRVKAAETIPSTPAKLNIDRTCRDLATSLGTYVDTEARTLPAAVLVAIKDAIKQGNANRVLPLTTLQDIILEFTVDMMPSSSSVDSPIEAVDAALRRQSATVLHCEPFLGQSSRHEAVLRSFLTTWCEPLQTFLTEQEYVKVQNVVVHVVRDLFLSTTRVVVPNVPLFGQDFNANPTGAEPSPAPMSTAASRSSAPSSSNTSSTDSAARHLTLQRLSLLCPTIEAAVRPLPKPSKVLSYWPAERGTDTRDYISSVAVEADKQFDPARQRLQRIEAKKRAQTERFKRPAFKKQGLPERDSQADSQDSAGKLPSIRTSAGPVATQTSVPQVQSSQPQEPASSQSQGPSMLGVTMSQPTAGLFGNRKKAKKTKKRSGFR